MTRPILILRALEHQQWSDEKQRLIPLKCAKCDRCKRPHARVYEIEVDGVRKRVGPTCLLRELEALPVNDRRRTDALKAATKRAWDAADEQGIEFWEEAGVLEKPVGLVARVRGWLGV
jgi:hypothetical protein